ncbi:LuxR C-terminal-related transcriptional regulator, partial [Klebsiella pneumoniae]|nr:LuxR C-terminal-related transcriptional regulator [Klebsiella pneumoniae]
LPSYNPTPAENKILSLSEQEIKIMRYILSGAPNQNIAAEMNINSKTVSTYKRRLMGKLNCKTLKDLFVFS